MAVQTCPECDAAWPEGTACQDYFHELLGWEAEDFSNLGEVHHLTVLCYHLQHPSLYSPEGLAGAKQLLLEFVECGVSPAEVGRRNRLRLNSSQRKWKVTGTPGRHGAYALPIRWSMTVADIVAGGRDHYCDNVRAWARTTLEALKATADFGAGPLKKVPHAYTAGARRGTPHCADAGGTPPASLRSRRNAERKLL
jgi:hypothetical protein